VFENQLILMIGFQNHGELIKTAQPSYELHATHKEDSDGRLLTANGVEINILDILRFVFHKGTPLKN